MEAMTMSPARALAEAMRDGHTPAMQEENSYAARCERCSFTRHPCDVYVLAVAFLDVLDAVDITLALLSGVDEPTSE